MRWVVLAVLVLTVSVWVQGHNSQVENWQDDIATCQRSNAGRVDAASRDDALAAFAERAAQARRESGDVKVAADYQEIASEARVREDRTLGRNVDCADEFPKPSLLPF